MVARLIDDNPTVVPRTGDRLIDAGRVVIGYDKASAIAHDADRAGRALRESALDSGYISAADFDRIANPATMVGPF